MTTKACNKSGREHTPIISESQQGLFGSELARRRSGKRSRLPGITTAELESHLHESSGKDLPKYSKKSRQGSGVFSDTEIKQGYRRI